MTKVGLINISSESLDYLSFDEFELVYLNEESSNKFQGNSFEDIVFFCEYAIIKNNVEFEKIIKLTKKCSKIFIAGVPKLSIEELKMLEKISNEGNTLFYFLLPELSFFNNYQTTLPAILRIDNKLIIDDIILRDSQIETIKEKILIALIFGQSRIKNFNISILKSKTISFIKIDIDFINGNLVSLSFNKNLIPKTELFSSENSETINFKMQSEHSDNQYKTNLNNFTKNIKFFRIMESALKIISELNYKIRSNN